MAVIVYSVASQFFSADRFQYVHCAARGGEESGDLGPHWPRSLLQARLQTLREMELTISQEALYTGSSLQSS